MFTEKQFRVRGLEGIKVDVEKVYPHYRDIDRIFLADGNALCIDTSELKAILEHLYSSFEKLERVTIYGGPLDIIRKSVDELRDLKKSGLSMIYLGLESGSQEVLKRIKKGATPEMMVEASRKVKEAGIPLSVIFILGLGGKELSEVHARETGKVLSMMDPEYAAALTLMVDEGAPIENDVRTGKLTLLGPEEVLKELMTIVDGLELTDCLFRANHASNYHPIGGRLPGDRNMVLAQIDRALLASNFKPEYFRRL
jgi:radical SAM superfamily enzyme YgiQ (UPF0313 family)